MTSNTIDIRKGDVYKTPNGPIQVQYIKRNGDPVVTDPTIQHTQDIRSGEWKIEREIFEDDLEDGLITEATLTVTEDDE